MNELINTWLDVKLWRCVMYSGLSLGTIEAALALNATHFFFWASV